MQVQEKLQAERGGCLVRGCYGCDERKKRILAGGGRESLAIKASADRSRDLSSSPSHIKAVLEVYRGRGLLYATVAQVAAE
jgi:hypothetical protein